MDNTKVENFQVEDGAIDDSKVASNADIAQSKIENLESDLANKVNKTGDTMTGFLTLNADPTQPLHLVTKQYVDSKSGSINVSQDLLINTTGLKMTWVNATQVKVTAGAGLDTTSSGIILLPSDTIVDISMVGINGRDTSDSIQNGKFYYIHLIGDSTGVHPSGLLYSLSVTSPTLPSGYNIFKPIGFVYIMLQFNTTTDPQSSYGSTFPQQPAGQIKKFDCIGSGSFRRLLWEDMMYVYPHPSASPVDVWQLQTTAARFIPVGITTNPLINIAYYNGNLSTLKHSFHFRKPGSNAVNGEFFYNSTETARSNSAGGVTGEITTDTSGNFELMISGYPTSAHFFYIKGYNFEI
jgi:hypothetical protein